ncbi:macro domain-containing protein [Anaerovibrio sp. RM50]|uniref:macro domain-containing protein n=1 Tax=Anaerovibrio sp. RM50 TaxID=1200557 RepID=UPI0006870AE6|nr:macro domain-containing protein [Anaerovibrio sp. RM50]
MKVYLLDQHTKTVDMWKLYFGEYREVVPVCDNFAHFMDNTDIECVVSPANSYGLMDGGYDLAISKYFGWELQKKVQQYILDYYYGEQPVGTSFIIETGLRGIQLIHTPTMIIPSKIKDPLVIYQCMRTSLITALKNGIKSIVIPAFGGGCGYVSTQLLCEMMYEGYKQVMNPPEALDWEYAERWRPERDSERKFGF